MEAWLDDLSSWSMFIHGKTGSRKTSLAIATILKYRLMLGEPPIGDFVPAYEAVRIFRSLDNPQTAQRLRKWRATSLLVLDDLGKHRDTPNTVEQLLFLLHYRYDWADDYRRTIVTSQMSLDELGSRIDGATARRLSEGAVLELERPKGD